MYRLDPNTTRALFFTMLIALPNLLHSQEMKPRFDRNEVMREALEWQYVDSLELALEEYEKIPFNDSAFVYSALERSHLLLKLERPEEAIVIADKGIEMPEESSTYKLYINKGVAYDQLEKYDEALAHWDSVMAIYPNAARIKYYKAMTYRSMEEHQKALDLLKEIFTELPYYPNIHLMLGNYAASEGNITQALMCYDMFLVFENRTERAFNVLSYANEMVSRKLDDEAKGVVLSEKGDDFEEIDLIIKNYVALQKGYKVSTKVALPFVKQNHLMFEMLKDLEVEGGFWSEEYLPLFQQIWEQNTFNGFMYHCLVASKSKTHKKLVAKNESQITQFLRMTTKWLTNNWVTRTGVANGLEGQYRYWYDDSGMLEAIGNLNEDQSELEGPFSYFHGNGRLQKEGVYDQEGKMTGTWKTFYANGLPYEVFDMKASELDGPFEIFRKNGAQRENGAYKDGKSEGPGKEYYWNGALARINNYVDDKLSGTSEHFYLNGAKRTVLNYKEGKLDGEYKKYYSNGALKFETQYKDDKRLGASTEYFIDGTINSVYQYEDGKANGAFQIFFNNGQVSAEGRMKDDVLIGEYRSYFKHGELEEITSYDETGKKNGIAVQMDEDGKKTSEFEYKKGDIVAYKYFDKEGNILKEGRKKGGEFLVESYEPTGELTAVGMYEYGGGKTGEWKYYYKDGTLSAEEFFEDGLLSGISKNYHQDGSLYWKADYTEGQLDGYYAEYDPTGTLRSERWYKEGTRVGNSYAYHPDGALEAIYFSAFGDLHGVQEYYTVAGKLDRKETYDHGFRTEVVWYDTLGGIRGQLELPAGTGQYITPNYDGSPRFKGNYENGWAQGEFQWYQAEGNLTSMVTYLDDSKHGPAASFYENGVKESEKNYEFGNVEGSSKWYYENGGLSSEWNYVKDKAHGEQKGYHENGKLSAIRNYEWGAQHGRITFFGEDEAVELIRYYYRGTLVGYSYLGANGEPVDTIPIKGGSGKMEPKYSNGNNARYMEFKNGKIHGKFLKFHSNGNKWLESEMLLGEENGTETKYYSNGNIRYIEQYIYGTLHGTCEYFYENGKKKKILKYVNGELHGECIYFDEKTGEKSTKLYYGDYEYK